MLLLFVLVSVACGASERGTATHVVFLPHPAKQATAAGELGSRVVAAASISLQRTSVDHTSCTITQSQSQIPSLLTVSSGCHELARERSPPVPPQVIVATLADECVSLHGLFYTRPSVFNTTDGSLVETLWHKRDVEAGQHNITWSGGSERIDNGDVGGTEVRVQVSNVSYEWDGVVGNTGPSTGQHVLRSYLPPLALASVGNQVGIEFPIATHTSLQCNWTRVVVFHLFAH
jgi:hypothetical protein